MPKTLEEARWDYAHGYYPRQLEKGLEFQDFVARALLRRGIPIPMYTSRRFQYKEGENVLGAEIKRDGNFRRTKNLYFETAEKADPDNENYVPSGIHRGDNSWLYIIGDERTIWIFNIKHLRDLENQCGWKKVETPTSKGFLMPLKDVEHFSGRRIDLGPEESR